MYIDFIGLLLCIIYFLACLFDLNSLPGDEGGLYLFIAFNK